MRNVDISFVIPIYNGKNTIEKCIESIEVCHYFNYEIILINDGSTDGTNEVVDKLSERNECIQVIHSTNQGQGMARNLGISRAQGSYIMFVDADDTIIGNVVDEMLNLAKLNGYDVVCGTYYRIEEIEELLVSNGISEGRVSATTDIKSRQRFEKLKDKSAFGYMWNKLYRREFLSVHKIELDPERKVFMEDFIFNLKVWVNQPKYYYYNKPCYRFDVRFESTTRKRDDEIVGKSMKTIESYFDYLQKQSLYQKHLNLIIPLAMRVCAYSLIKNIPYEGLSFKQLQERIKSYLQSPAYRCMVRTKGSLCVLQKTTSVAEKVLYTIIFLCIKFRCCTLLACVFWIGYPVFKRYLKQNVK